MLDLELARLRAMTPSEKVGVMNSMWREAWSLTSAGIRARYPDWTNDQVAVEARRIIGGESR